LVAALAGGLIAATVGMAGAQAAPLQPAGRAAAASGPGPALVAEDQALAKARQTHQPQNVSAAQTPTATVTANPDGTLTLQVTPQPVRKLVQGTWHSLDATLLKNPDGTISPTLTTTPLTLSGGGLAPLATMRSGADSLSLTLPAQLPAPDLSGNTATYRNVLPGTDLVVSADTQGGFSDVFVVRDAAAAANPQLTALLSATMTARGLTVGTDSRGDITATNRQGSVVFGAPAPEAWDSATSTGPATAGPATAGPATSSVAAPGAHAHRGRLSARVTGRTLTLVPDDVVIHGPNAAFPIFFDPSWTSGQSGWSTPSQNFPGDPHWNSSAESQGLMQVGESPADFWADTLINFSLPLGTLGPEGTKDDIQSATFFITNVGANNCTKQTVDLYAPSATLNSKNADWNDWFTQVRRPSLGGAVSSASLANGWSSSCPAASVGFPMTGASLNWLRNDVAAGKATQTLALAGTSYGAEQFNGNGAGANDYEVFDSKTPVLSITYMHAPATPTGLSTSPNAATIGRGDVALNVPVADPDGGGLAVTITAAATSTGAVIDSATMKAQPSGGITVLRIPEATLNADVISSAFGGKPGNTTLGVSWSAVVSNGDGTFGTVASATKTFTYDISDLGAPIIYLDKSNSTQCTVTSEQGFSYTAGTPASFYLAPGDTSQGIPVSYTYQLNNGEPVSVAASGGTATATIVPTQSTNILTVYGVSAGGNTGQQQSCVINAGAPAPAADGDLTGDGSADLLVPGTGSTALPAGLWLAAGTGGGAVSTNAANIGLKGTGISTAQDPQQSPAQWTGTQVITGQFHGPGFNDVLDYAASTSGTSACSGSLLASFGQALPLNPVNGSQVNVSSDVFTFHVFDSADNQFDTPVCASSVASAGNLFLAENGASAVATSYPSPTFPDLLVVVDGSLMLEPQDNSPANWAGLGSTDPDGEPTSTTILSDTNPTGTGDWTGWTITTTLLNDIPAMFAVSPTGAVYYYSPAAVADLGYAVLNSTTVSGAAAPVQVAASGFGADAYARLQAAGFTGPTPGATAPGLWAVTADGKVTAYQLTPAGAGLTATGPPAGLVTATHSWPLNDQDSGTVAAAADDTAGGQPLTGNSGASWSVGDAIFSPDVTLDGTSGDLATSAFVIDLTKSFTVSAWANPTSAGGVLLSQDGSAVPGLTVGITGTSWSFGLNTGAGTSGTFDTVTGGSSQLGQWSQVTASYDAGAGIMSLYVDGVLVGYAKHKAPASGATGPFHIGSAQGSGGGSRKNFFAGQVAEAQEWNQALAATTTPALASYHHTLTPTRIMDTRTGTGGTIGPVAAGSVTRLKITDTAMIPASGVTAVAIDLTVTKPTASGNVVPYADGSQKPAIASLNFDAGTTVTSYQIVPVSPDGQIDLYLMSAGTAQLIVDVTGYFGTSSAAGAQTYHPVTATRILDTRSGLGAPQAQLANGSTTAIQAAGGTGSVPAGAVAVAVNLTATRETGGGFLEVYPAGTAIPATTALSYSTGTVASLAGDVPVGSGGKISVTNYGAATDLIADIAGYYTSDGSGDVYHAISPVRLTDTRIGLGGPPGPVAATGTYPIASASLQHVTTAASLVPALNITVTQPAAAGNLVAYQADKSQPATSNLNWSAAQTVANLALVPAGTTDAISLFNGSTGTIHLVIDCSGFFALN
jgi:hypothetical protein